MSKNIKISIQFVGLLLVKIAFLFLFPWSDEFYKSSIGYSGGDTFSYYPPLESLLNNGQYFEDFRMPGLAFPYVPLRLILNETMALNALIVIQVLFSVVSILLLAKIVLLLTKKTALYYWVLILYGLSTFVSKYDNVLLTESLFTSTLILVIYLLVKPGKKRFFVIGFLLIWLVFLKPIAILLIPTIILWLVFSDYRNTKKISMRPAVIALPAFLLLSIWVVRNYNEHHRFFLLTKSLNYPTVENSYLSHAYAFVSSFGGSCVYWKPKAEITFFYKGINKDMEECTQFPDYIYTSKFNKDNMLKLQQLVQQVESIKNPQLKQSLNAKAERLFDSYTRSIADEKPFLYHIGSRFSLLKSYLVHSGTMNLFNEPSENLNSIQLLMKVGYSLLYLFTVIFGFLGMIYFFLRKKWSNLIWLILPASYFSLIYPLGLRMDEFRYYVPAYPFMLVIGILFIYCLVENIRPKDSKPIASTNA